jgi:hypothetical protein
MHETMIRVTFNFGFTGIALALDFWILGYDPPAVKQVVQSNPGGSRTNNL